MNIAPGGRPICHPRVVARVKALARELPKERGISLSRYSTPDLGQVVVERGIVASITGRLSGAVSRVTRFGLLTRRGQVEVR